MTRRRAALLLTVGAALVAAGSALAGTPIDPNAGDTVLGKAGGLRYASDSARFDPTSGGFADVEAGCGGPSWSVVGGGARLPISNLDFLAATRPIDYVDPDSTPDDGWDGAGTGEDHRRMTTFAICANDLKVRYVHVAIPTGGPSRFATASCGGPRWHVADGGVFIATVDSYVNSSYPIDGPDADKRPDDGWAGRVYDAIGGAGVGTVDAICLRGASLDYERARDRLPPHSVGAAALSCQIRRHGHDHAIGGGAHVGGPIAEAHLAATYPGAGSAELPDDGWSDGVSNDTGSRKEITSFAICLR